MKKGFKALLVTTILSLTVASSVFAADPYENPVNDFYFQAQTVSPGTGAWGYLSSGDTDWYKFTPYFSGQQRILFHPPDDQVYNVLIFEASTMESGGGTAIASKTIVNGSTSTNEFSFNVQGGKSYYALVSGSANLSRQYVFAVIGQ
ncbi:hypothetical protein NQ117_08330 [Paenibacillus sp. SC116]|uniref:hypothetical protein n=1 Tax=Paenibacillus sp. SC116 TaxID=2968986 RepID=UPI00215A721F|nr:hypothetical protein [Paenibacillus sp. SC116]MCR8843691.1 hypothetical protein [Paenibacillus sp. SC116]